MKNIIILIACGLVLFSCAEKGEPYTPISSKSFVKFYGKSKIDEANDFVQTADDGYLIVGSITDNYNTANDDVGDKQFYVIKVDQYGNKEWEVSLGDSNLEDYAKGVIIADDGSYVVVGTKSFESADSLQLPYSNIFLVNLDQDGNPQWQNDLIGTPDVDETGNSVSQLNDGSYVIVGTTDAANAGNNNAEGSKDGYVTVVNSDGTLPAVVKLNGQIGGPGDDELIACFAKDPWTIGLGRRFSDNGNFDIYLAVIDNEKKEAADYEELGGDGDDLPGMIFNDGATTLMIGTDKNAAGKGSSWFSNYTYAGEGGKDVKLSDLSVSISDDNGNMEGRSLCKSSDGNGYVLLSTIDVSGARNHQLTYVDKSGVVDDTQFATPIFGNDLDDARKIIKTSDGGYAILGNTKFGTDQRISLIKLNENGELE